MCPPPGRQARGGYLLYWNNFVAEFVPLRFTFFNGPAVYQVLRITILQKQCPKIPFQLPLTPAFIVPTVAVMLLWSSYSLLQLVGPFRWMLSTNCFQMLLNPFLGPRFFFNIPIIDPQQILPD